MSSLDPEVDDAEKAIRKSKINRAFAGKTVVGVDCGSCNTWTFHFADGTAQKVWSEDAVYTPYGNISGLFLEEELR
jgi:hypothetical protein